MDEPPGFLEQKNNEADGPIFVPLCETPTERTAALEFVKRPEIRQLANWLVAVPQPLNNFAGLVQEVQRWERVSTNTLELNADKYAREEVSRQKAAAHSQLQMRIGSFIGWKQTSAQMALHWFHEGRPLKVKDGRQLLEELSRIFDEIYALAPRIQNELVNRRVLSSAAAAARMRLVEDEFFDLESFSSRADFLAKAATYPLYFNLGRPNSHKENQTPWQLIQRLAPRSPLELCLLPSVKLDYFLNS